MVSQQLHIELLMLKQRAFAVPGGDMPENRSTQNM